MKSGRKVFRPTHRGGLFIGDRSNRCVRRLARRDDRRVVETVAGNPNESVAAKQLEGVRAEGKSPTARPRPKDGKGKEAVFAYLHSNVIADGAGNAYVMDGDSSAG